MKLVDSSVWIEFLRRKGNSSVKQVLARLLETDQAAFTCPVRFELLSGARPDEVEDLREALSLAHHLPFLPEDWMAAASSEQRLRQSGVTIPRNDLFVVTVALRARLTLVCRDLHFDLAGQALGDALAVEQI